MSIKAIYTLFLLYACGSARRNVRIIGGTKAALGQFPSVVSLNIVFNEEKQQLCGASIVGNSWVVTAAHCAVYVANSNNVDIQADSLNPLEGGTIYNVTNLIVHENYSDHPHYYDDIALLKLDRDIVLSDTAQIAEIGESVGNDCCAVVGWGSTENSDASDTLLYVNVTALTEEDCARLAEGGTFNTERGPGQVCAYGGKGKAACYGDSGGPLICDAKLVGIVSYGIEPFAQGYPDVYSRVSYYVDWINSTISSNN